MRHFLALDLGGTKTAAGVVTERGETRAHLRVPTRELRASGDPLAALLQLGRDALRAAGDVAVVGVGLALPGPVRPPEVRLLAAPTFPELENRDLAAPFREAFGGPVAGDNDANACALAEYRFGAARGYRHAVYLTISTGIGGGIVVDGHPFAGSGGTAAEFGHQVLLPEGGPPCDCGNHGCLEALASGRGIARRARELLAREPDPALPAEALTAERLADAARAGHPLARRVWHETAVYLGLGLANVINCLDPEIIVLGGGVGCGAADLLLPEVREVVRRRCMPRLARAVAIVPAALGAEVGLVGAACLAMDL